VSSNLKGRRMQMNVLRTKQVSHVENRNDHGQPIASGDGHRCHSTVSVDGWAVTFGTARRRLSGRNPPRPLLAVPNVTAHQ